MHSNSAQFRELVDRVIRSFFRIEVEMRGFWVVVLGVESASSLARRAAACLVHYLGLRLLVDALSSPVMKRCRESSISSSRCGLSRVRNCGRLGGLHIFWSRNSSRYPHLIENFLQEWTRTTRTKSVLSSLSAVLCVMKNVKQVPRVSVDSSLSMSRWDNFDHRALGYISCHRLKSLSAYSMSIYAFFRACGGMNWKTRVPPTRSPIWSYIFLFLSTASSSLAVSLLSSALKPSSSSLGSCHLGCPVEQWWELAKTCRKDECCFGSSRVVALTSLPL